MVLRLFVIDRMWAPAGSLREGENILGREKFSIVDIDSNEGTVNKKLNAKSFNVLIHFKFVGYLY